MNYIEAFKKKFERLPTEKEIAILMEAVAEEDQANMKNRLIRYTANGFKATNYK